MKQYKHYSFDLWGTLIKSNPEYKKARTAYFMKHFNRLALTEEQVTNIFINISNTCNTVAEVTGEPVTSQQMYAMVLHKMGYPTNDLYIRDIEGVMILMDNLLLEHNPVLFDEYTKYVLFKLCERGALMSLLSNTGFARGYILDKVLTKLGIGLYFDMKFFSDQIGLSKPDSRLYKLMIDAASRSYSAKFNTYLPLHEIVHVGDSTKADIKGATAAGIQGFFVNAHGVTIKDLL